MKRKEVVYQDLDVKQEYISNSDLDVKQEYVSRSARNRLIANKSATSDSDIVKRFKSAKQDRE